MMVKNIPHLQSLQDAFPLWRACTEPVEVGRRGWNHDLTQRLFFHLGINTKLNHNSIINKPEA